MSSRTAPISKAYDIVCIGFGNKGLAFATALADSKTSANILILEKEKSFNGNLNYASPDKIGGSPFLRDLITQQNPRSPYTFISFLHEHKLLAGFTNASQMTTFRGLTSRYMSWMAQNIEALDWVAYGKQVVRVQPVETSDRGQTALWTIEVRDTATSIVSHIRTKRVIVATGSVRTLPTVLSQAELQPFVLPLHDTAELMSRIYRSNTPAHIAIIGADQEAAELFELLQSMPGQHRVTMLITGSALRVDDHTPFTQALVDGADQQFIQLPPEIRKRLASTKVSKEHPTIDLHTLETIYISQYVEKVTHLNSDKPRFSIQALSEITRAQVTQNSVSFAIRNTSSGKDDGTSVSFDIIMAAPVQGKLTADALLSSLSTLYDSAELNVGTDYSVNFRRGKLASDCRIWVLGSLLDRNQRRDDFTMLATSAHRALESVQQSLTQTDSDRESKDMAVL